MSEWLAGAYEVDITPPLDVPLGSGFNPPQVEGIADRLSARALVLSDGEDRVALASCDILAIDPMLSSEIRRLVRVETGIPPSHVMVSATHTHSCGGRLQPSRGNGDPALIEILARQIAGAINAAARQLSPVSLTAGAVRVEGISLNRRDPEAPIDNILRALRVDSEHGLMAVLTVFACHPVLVSRDRAVISAEFPGVLTRMVKAALGASVVVLSTTGACGDVNPVSPHSTGLDSARWIGQRLAGETLALLARMESAGRPVRTDNTRWGLTVTHDAGDGVRLTRPSIRAGTTMARVPYKEFGPADESTAAAARAADQLLAMGTGPEIVERWKKGRTVAAETEAGLTPDGRAARRHLAAELLKRRSEAWMAGIAAHQGVAGVPHRELELQAFVLGDDVALLATPFELFSRVALDIHAASPVSHLFLIGYSNDLGGYLMPDEEQPRGGFEPGITPYGPGAADAVRDGCLALLTALVPRISTG